VRALHLFVGAQISSTTSVMISIRAASSSGSRCRFSVDSRYTVAISMPASAHQRSISAIFLAPIR
jgi:hypothetical protein